MSSSKASVIVVWSLYYYVSWDSLDLCDWISLYKGNCHFNKRLAIWVNILHAWTVNLWADWLRIQDILQHSPLQPNPLVKTPKLLIHITNARLLLEHQLSEGKWQHTLHQFLYSYRFNTDVLPNKQQIVQHLWPEIKTDGYWNVCI